MPIENIQRLFGIISAEQVTNYLKQKGWQVSNSGDALNCHMTDGSGELQTIGFPAQTAHPRFRKLLPNAIFKLAVIEGREAIDIANAIYETAQADTPTTSPATAATITAPIAASSLAAPQNSTTTSSSISQVIFKNTSDSDATLHVSLDRSIELPPGQSVCLENRKQAPLVVKFSGQVYLELADGSTAADCNLWFQTIDVPAAELRELWIMQYLASALDRDGQLLGQKAEKLPGWQSAVQRYLFALTGLGQTEADARSWRLATGCLLCEIIQSLPPTSHWKKSVYELTLRLAALGKQRMKVDAMAADDLWRAAVSDTIVAPQKTYLWLGSATIPS